MSRNAIRVIAEQFDVVVPPAQLSMVRKNLEQLGLILQETPATLRSGVVLHAQRVVEFAAEVREASGRPNASVWSLRSRTLPAADEALDDDSEPEASEASAANVTAVLSGGGYRRNARLFLGPRERVWLKVYRAFEDDFVQTGYELGVLDEPDADRQLELLATVAQLPRSQITIKPKPGWEGYGHGGVFGHR